MKQVKNQRMFVIGQ